MFPNELTNPAPANWPPRFNEAFKSLRGRALYAPNDLTTTGRILGYFGGHLGDIVIANGTVGPLAASATSYVVAHRTTGVVTHATDTTNWNNTTTYGRVFKVTTDASVITSAIDWALQDGGILRGGGASTAGPNVQSVASAATVTPTFADDLVRITAQAAALTLANPSGIAVEGWGVVIRIKDNGTARAIAYGSQYRAIGVTLPTTTVVGKTLYLGCIWNDSATKLDVLAVGQEA